jgi:hypothetical protein
VLLVFHDSDATLPVSFSGLYTDVVYPQSVEKFGDRDGCLLGRCCFERYHIACEKPFRPSSPCESLSTNAQEASVKYERIYVTVSIK